MCHSSWKRNRHDVRMPLLTGSFTASWTRLLTHIVRIAISMLICIPHKTLANEFTPISGIINSYARVTNISDTHISIDHIHGDIQDFQAGRKLMIMQMKGATMSQDNNDAYGNIVDLGSCGLHEFFVVESFSGTEAPYHIVYADLLHSYSPSGVVQLISVPGYQNALVNAPLTAADWNPATGTGGVLALEVSGTLSLEANINVNGKGFPGGTKGGSSGANNNASLYKSSSNDFGMKGESIALPVSGENYAKGRHTIGGGGGNTHNGGGGGGGNSTRGGNGGNGWSGAGDNANTGGIGGTGINYTSNNQRILLGGGGGSGQQNNSAGGAGGYGGGIIIIRAGSISSSASANMSITANGTEGENSGNDGAGGGGAGGSIKIESLNWTTGQQLTIQANGANGGNVGNSAAHGSGGGGGIGIIQMNQPTPENQNITVASSPGLNGLDCNQSGCISSGILPETPQENDALITGVVFFGELISLPVTLFNFNAVPIGQHIKLSWSTLCEINNDYFTLEKSMDGKSFKTLAVISGNGTTREIHEYIYTDNNPHHCNNYYRLSQTDYDGTKHYFPVIWADGIENTFDDLQIICVFPNRFQQELNIDFYADQEGKIELNFHNLRGEKVQQFYFYAEKGKNQITFHDGNLLNPELYIIYLRRNQSISRKLRILRESI